MPAKELEVALSDSVSEAAKHGIAFNKAMDDMATVLAERDWPKLEDVRERMHVAIDGYIDCFAAATRRTQIEQETDDD